MKELSSTLSSAEETKEALSKSLRDQKLLLATNKKMYENFRVIAKLSKDNFKIISEVADSYETEAETDPTAESLKIATAKVSSMMMIACGENEKIAADYLEMIRRQEQILTSLEKLMSMPDEEFETAVLQAQIQKDPFSMLPNKKKTENSN